MKKFWVFLLFFLCELTAWCAPSVIFSGEVGDIKKLFTLDLENFGIATLSQGTSSEFQATLASNKQTLAFVSDKDGALSLFELDLASPTTPWKNISAGMGAYAHPSFSPDGSVIAVRYAPDPEAPLEKTRLVLLDPKTRKQTYLIDGASCENANSNESVFVIDHPHWIDNENLVFAVVEYSDLDMPRMTSGTIFSLNTKDMKPKRLVGGESYFNEAGMAKGYMSSLPRVCGNMITYAAIEGHVTRTPMSVTFDGLKKSVIPINDPEFFGPIISFDGGFLYVIQDQNGKLGLARKRAETEKREIVSFIGSIMDPILVK